MAGANCTTSATLRVGTGDQRMRVVHDGNVVTTVPAERIPDLCNQIGQQACTHGHTHICARTRSQATDTAETRGDGGWRAEQGGTGSISVEEKGFT